MLKHFTVLVVEKKPSEFCLKLYTALMVLWHGATYRISAQRVSAFSSTTWFHTVGSECGTQLWRNKEHPPETTRKSAEGIYDCRF